MRRLVTFLAEWMLATAAITAVVQCYAAEPERIALWSDGAPGEPTTRPDDEPAIFLHRPEPEKSNGTAVIVCPGGGYGHLAITYEGHELAEWFRSLGVTGIVLKYRHNASGHKHPVPMTDGQRAIRTVRTRATEWGIDPKRIGVLGFSAGGHLASTLATHFDGGDAKSADAINRASSRPDFLILCYPVITMTEKYMHAGSKKNLIGQSPDEELARSLSNDLWVTSETPPTFIFQTDEDKSVPAENSVSFYLALRRAGVPAEMHIYQNGRHGVGLAKDIPATNDWPDRCRAWMEVRGLLTAQQ